MANRIKIRRGNGIPTTSSLLPYELGWNTANKILYINDNNNAIEGIGLRYINTTDNTTWTADTLGATTSIAFTRTNITGAYTTGHIVWLNANDIGTPFQLVVHDSSDLYLYKRWKNINTGIWGNWTKMNAGYADSAGSAGYANKLGTSTIGSSARPIYLSSGVPTLCATPTSGSYFGGVPYVANDGVMEVGKYIDFHNSNTGTTDYDVRLTATTQLTSSTTIEATGLLKTTNNSNTVTIGSQNASFCHIYNSASIPFIFSNSVLTTSGDLGNTSYPFNNIYLGAGGDKGIYYKGTKNTYRMISFIDNTSDVNGNGISIGGGGLTIIGGGESADTLVGQAGTAGAEVMWICNDWDIDFFPGLLDGYNATLKMTLNTSGNLLLHNGANAVIASSNSTARKIFVTTSASVPSGAANGDIVLVKA